MLSFHFAQLLSGYDDKVKHSTKAFLHLIVYCGYSAKCEVRFALDSQNQGLTKDKWK